LLLERSPIPIDEAVEQVGGLQTQYAPSGYVGLWSRLASFKRDDLTAALENRSVVQATLMRVTIHLVSPGDWWRWATAIRDHRRESWLKYHRDLSASELETAARRVRARLSEGPATRAELQELIGKGSAGVNGISLWLDLVRIPPSGTWERRRADLYALAEEWLGPDPGLDPDDAVAELVRSYLRGFGPAAPAEIADWAGVAPKRVGATLEQMKLRRFVDCNGKELVDLPRAPLPDPETPAPVRFLPVWDATLLAHARRTQILPEQHRSKVFNVRTPQSTNTFLVDGQVAGTWKYEKGRVLTEPFARLDAADRRAVAAEGERLADLHA
jgi:hypothetical protein